MENYRIPLPRQHSACAGAGASLNVCRVMGGTNFPILRSGVTRTTTNAKGNAEGVIRIFVIAMDESVWTRTEKNIVNEMNEGAWMRRKPIVRYT
jgi:hypothetical protein